MAQRRLPRPIRQARKMKQGTIIITRQADQKFRALARDYRVTPEVVMGLYLTFEVARMEHEASGG